MTLSISALKSNIRAITGNYRKNLDAARSAGLDDATIAEGYLEARKQYEQYTQQLREARAQRRAELEQQAYSMPRLHQWATVSAGAQELIASRDAVSRARAARDADELAAYMDAALELGDEVMAHSCWLEAQRRGAEEGDMSSVVGGASGPYAAMSQQYLANYPARAQAVQELAGMGGLVNGEEPIADDVLDAMALVGPEMPEEARRYEVTPENPFEQEPEQEPEPPTLTPADADAVSQGLANVGRVD